MKTYNQINDKIASGKAVVLTAEEMKDYIDKYGVRKAAKEIDVVTTATFGPMCSSGVFLNFDARHLLKDAVVHLGGPLLQPGFAFTRAALGVDIVVALFPILN